MSEEVAPSAESPEVPGRILEMSRDPLFKSVFPERTWWVQTGRPLEPFGRHAGHAGIDRVGVGRALAALAARRFDFVVFPAVRLSVPGDAHNRFKARVRRLLVAMARFGPTPSLVEAILGLGSTTYIIRDVGDFPDLDEAGTALLPRAALYSKREVLEGDLANAAGGRRVVYTPMPFEMGLYDAVVKSEKLTDVFYAARPNSDLRREAHEVLSSLSAEGVVVDVPEERLDLGHYLQRMAQARLVISPRGQGEHCYRHYEALLVGSVPVINRPLRPIHYSLRHGETCLFYPPEPGGLRQQILDGLSDETRLAAIAGRGAELVRATHDKAAICRMLLFEAGLSSQ